MAVRKVVFIGFILVLLLGGISVYQLGLFSDGKLYIIFCDVGQGDAIFVRTPRGLDILVDGGPDETVLSCLSSHMPFWDRDLELVVLTHPHNDHLSGLMDVIKRYKIISFATENLKNTTAAFKALMDELKNQNIKVQYLYAGDRFVFEDGIVLNIVGPSREFLEKTSPRGMIGERSEFANVQSLFKYKDFSILLTGDSQAVQLREGILDRRLGKVDILQVPHHGSKTGLDSEILDFLKPKLAVISVGNNNRYSHPVESMIQILRNRDIKTLRTDIHGEIKIISDGADWAVKN